MIPKFLQTRLDKAIAVVNSLKALADIPSMANRIALAKVDLDIVRKIVQDFEVSQENRNRKYSNEQIQAVLDSLLDTKGSIDHVALAIELNMNYASLIYFCKERVFCEGGVWTNTQDRVMVMMAKGDKEALTDMRERNKIGYAEYEANLAKKASNL